MKYFAGYMAKKMTLKNRHVVNVTADSQINVPVFVSMSNFVHTTSKRIVKFWTPMCSN